MPTIRSAKGSDMIVTDADETMFFGVPPKGFTKHWPVPLGLDLGRRVRTGGSSSSRPTATPLSATFCTSTMCADSGADGHVDTCDNRLNIRRDALEASILNGLRKHLMEPALFKEFCAEFTREVNRLRIECGADLEGWKQELKRVDKELDKIVDAILEGFPTSKLKDKAEKLEARKAELADKLANADKPPPLMHPNMAGLYAQRIGQLYEHLQDEESRPQAAETFRSLVDQVTLVPDNGELAIVLSGDLGAILRFSAGKKNPDFLAEAEALDNLLSPGSLVAGVRNRRPLRNDPGQQKTSCEQ